MEPGAGQAAALGCLLAPVLFFGVPLVFNFILGW